LTTPSFRPLFSSFGGNREPLPLCVFSVDTFFSFLVFIFSVFDIKLTFFD